MKKHKELWFALAFVLVAALAVDLTAKGLRPEHRDFGSTWEAYRCEPKNSVDVLFVGSSYAYCDWNPGVIYGETGLTSYVMAGSEQTPQITYWYLKEALKTQTPSAVVMEGTSLFFHQYQAYTQINVGYMPWGLARLGATFTAAEPDKRLGLLFDLYFYHDRWKEMTLGEFRDRVLARPAADQLKGFTAVETVFAETEGGPFLHPMEQTPAEHADALRAFEGIAGLCREKNIPLIVTVNPTYSQYSQETYDALEGELREIDGGVTFVNWSGDFEKFGMDPVRHLSDGGHLNRAGAALFSAGTAAYLEEFGLRPREQTAENAAAWGETVQYWENWSADWDAKAKETGSPEG